MGVLRMTWKREELKEFNCVEPVPRGTRAASGFAATGACITRGDKTRDRY
jgi:hypothetical protein